MIPHLRDSDRRSTAAPPRRAASNVRPPRASGSRQVAGRSRPTSLSRALSAAEGRERERIAVVLHDEVGALIVQIRLRLGEWRVDARPVPAPQIDEVCRWLASVSHTVRTLTTALAPPAWHGGLPEALAAMARELGLGAAGAGPAVHVDRSGPDFDLPEPLRAVVCRVVRELCLNVLKHARAKRLDITPQLVDGWLCIQVRDDGVGLSPRPHRSRADRDAADVAGGSGVGLAGARAQLRALGGSLHLRRNEGASERGTCATLLLPLAGHPVGEALGVAGPMGALAGSTP